MATTKGERTRQRLIETAAPLFNQRGYWGASVSDVMSAAGLEKGGIYNHFASKDDLALAAFEHNTDVIADLVRGGLEGTRHSIERLVALIEVYRSFAHHPPVPGGCPILNTAVEADDTHPALSERAREMLDLLREGTVGRIVERGIERGEIRTDVDPAEVATVLVAGIEGALMLNQVYGEPAHVDHMADHLIDYVRGFVPDGPTD
jgi:AcrR family transcriptional regulator